MPSAPARPRTVFARALAAAAALALCSCASVEFHRDTQTSGTVVSTGWAFTFFSKDIPSSALNIARENASDARQPNMVVEEATVTPYLGWFDFLLEIIGVRHARVSGTWGFRPE